MHDFADFASPVDRPPQTTPYSIEVNFPISLPALDVELFASSYVYRVGDRSMVAVTSWGDRFDGINEMFFGKYAEFREIYAEEFAAIWPTIIQLVENTEAGNTDAGALGLLIDPDDGIEKWVIAVTQKDVPEEQLDDMVDVVAERVTRISTHAYLDSLSQPTLKMHVKMAARAGAAGFRRSKDRIAPVENVLNWLQIMMGA